MGEPPKDTAGAALRYILLHPVPIQVYNFLPRLAVNSDSLKAYKMSLTEGAISEIVTQNSTCGTIGSTLYWMYPNDMGDFDSCATRVFRLLGINWERYIEDPVDPNKVGVMADVFDAMVHKAINDDVGVRHQRIKYDGLDYKLFAHAEKKIEIVILNDHVLFAIRCDLYNQVTQLDNDLKRSKNMKISTVRDGLKEKYPRNAGRAGGKIFLDFDEILPAVWENQYARAMSLALLNADNDWEQVAACALLLLPYTNHTGTDLSLFLLQNFKWISRLDFVDYIKVCKEVHHHVRMVGALPKYLRVSIDVQDDRAWANNIYGIDIIGGRSELMHLDFTKETVMRLMDPALRAVPTYSTTERRLYMSSDLYERYEDEATHEAVREVVKFAEDGVTLEGFDSWFDRRMFWGASGGAPGATIQWKENNEKLRVNKRGALLSIPVEYMRKIISKAEKAVQWSVKALKFESGKLRSILNTSIESYIIQAYVLDQFDKNLREDTWYSTAHGLTARVANMLRRTEELKTAHALMWDFSDFNINHTFRGMMKLYSVVCDVLVERGAHATPKHIYEAARKDIKAATAWILKARERTYVQDNDTGYISKLVRSLQSGERGTSFVNSMRNHIDYLIVRKTGSELFNTNFLTRKGDKQGDDVFLPTKDMKEAVLACALYNITGSAGQLSKITNDYSKPKGARGEYLRYAYDANANTVSGYPIRAMMGVIHGEFFDEPIPKPLERAATFVEQFEKLRRRGWTPPDTLLERAIKRNCHLVYTTGSGKKKVVTDIELVTLPSAFGGIGVTNTIDGKNMTQTHWDVRGAIVPPSRNGYIAVYIPSGEGKSTIAKRIGHPSVVIDHDSLVGPAFEVIKAKATLTGDWKPVNAYLRSLTVGLRDVVLLTWGHETCDSDGRIGELSILLRQPTSLRANKANRKAILKAKRNIEFSDSYTHSLAKVMACVLKLNRVTENGKELIKVREFSSTKNTPQFTYPRVAASAILRRARTHLSDYEAARKFGVAETAFIDEAALESALTGAFPKDPLYQAIAQYARALDEWVQAGRYIEKVIRIPQDDYQLFARLSVATFLTALSIKPGGSFNGKDLIKNEDGYPVIGHMRHFYNCVDRLTPIAGCSMGLVVRRLISKQTPIKYAGALGKIYNFLENLKRRRDSAHTLQQSYKEVDTISDIQDFIDRAMATGGDREAAHQVYSYITGTLSFIPPFNCGISTDIISGLRAAALVVFEDHFLARVTLPAQELAVWFSQGEYHTLSFFIDNYLSSQEAILLMD
ncbi:RNA-dependent RNA polymerase [Macrophomina phaseolina fusagravirus 1]|uniref:RNA-directed RNA polymerase n=1 Tax=Macrophomina phaseolina fusagravirus 1 TaxID=2594856 RepID=A0A515KU26_9VIRU|nr:RNA-dependent RNA polymerase [Macrophomina phaseolina fusagravirus 1]